MVCLQVASDGQTVEVRSASVGNGGRFLRGEFLHPVKTIALGEVSRLVSKVSRRPTALAPGLAFDVVLHRITERVRDVAPATLVDLLAS